MSVDERNTTVTTIDVPGEFAGLIRQAVLAEIGTTARWVQDQQEDLERVQTDEHLDIAETDFAGARLALERDFRLLDQVLAAPAGEPLALSEDVDDRSYTLSHVLQAMINDVLLPKLKDVCKYSPMDAGEVRGISEALLWASTAIEQLGGPDYPTEAASRRAAPDAR